MVAISNEKPFPATATPDPGWWHTLWPDPAAVILALGVQSGMDTVDLCHGDDYFTAPLAQRVDPGRVIDVDLDTLPLTQAREACRGLGTAVGIRDERFAPATRPSPRGPGRFRNVAIPVLS
ncbi:MAG: class I SAM-dependent methyltransferase [Acidiferrobacteraceae bacterium]